MLKMWARRIGKGVGLAAARPSDAEIGRIRRAIGAAYRTHLGRRALEHEVDFYLRLVAEGRVSLNGAVAAIAKSDEAAAAAARERRTYGTWVKRYDSLIADDADSIRRHIENFASRPVVSLSLAVGLAGPELVAETIASVRDQIYPGWELCVSSLADLSEELAGVVESACRGDSRITWLRGAGITSVHRGRQAGLREATGEFVAILHEGDRLAPHALYEVVLAIQGAAADLVYSDHDLITEDGERHAPSFKTDWNLDLFLECNFMADLVVFRSDLVAQAGGYPAGARETAAHELAAHVVSLVPDRRIRHIPSVLYHRRSPRRMLEEGLPLGKARVPLGAPLRSALLQSRSARVVTDARPRVSILIPTRNRFDLLCACVGSVLAKTTYADFEIIIIDHENTEPATLAYFEKLAAEPRVRIVPYGGPFNYSAMNNAAVRQARGDIIVLLNNDTEVISPDWLERMVDHAWQTGVGAVGALLLFPSGAIQHAGMVLGLTGVAGHIFGGCAGPGLYQSNRLETPTTVSGVTAACLAVRKSIYLEVGGLNEQDLAVAYNDVDLCLKIRAAGYRNVWTPHAVLYHHESPSRGSDADPRNRARWEAERDYMVRTWGGRLDEDPFYNVNLALDSPVCDLAFPPRRRRPWRDD